MAIDEAWNKMCYMSCMPVADFKKFYQSDFVSESFEDLMEQMD